MKQKIFLVPIALAALAFAVPTHAVEPKKGEVPASLCITAETQKMHAGTVAQYEKDIAPYKDNPAAQEAIAAYKEKIDAAWSALEQPYCGYGGYAGKGAMTSTIKSYNKTVVRAVSAFQEAIKGLGKAKTTPAPTESVKTEPVKSEPVMVESKLVVTPPPTPDMIKTEGTLRSGLARGQRSDAVLELQKRLTKYFKIEDASSIQTGFFGPKTEELVIKFQLDQKIIETKTSPGAGLVGPKTLKALLSV